MTRAKDISKIITDADFSGTLDVTGAVTASGLTMDTAGNSSHTLEFGANRTSDSQALGIIRGSWNGTVVSQINLSAGDDTTNKDNGQIFFRTASAGTTANRVQIAENGDISFYEDTGTTPKFIWDSSAESLTVDGVVTVDRVINATTSSDPWLKGVNGSNTETFFLKPSGQAYFGSNVSIGNASPTELLEVHGDTPTIKLRDTSAYSAYTGPVIAFQGRDNNESFTNFAQVSGLSVSSNNGFLKFETRLSGALNEVVRIDQSGNLLVGKTSTSFDTAGSGILSGGEGQFVRDGGHPISVNRKTSDGNLIYFAKDGTQVGSIGAYSSGIYIATTDGSDAGLGFRSNQVVPSNTTGGNRDNVIDLGSSGSRFDDIFATNGTIQTSDQNEKNTITDSDLGIDFIKRLSPKSYIFNGKTRTHYGLIAQDVETVLTDIGKTGTDFAGFIKSDISEEEDGSEYRYGLRYTEFVAPLIKAVKDQQAIIEDLQARITALETA